MVALDSRAEVLAAAAHANPAVRTTPGLTLQVGDGRSIPYPDRSFDIVHASLVLHHLSEADARAFIAEMGRVARLGIIVNDLSRSRLAWVGAWVMAHTLTRNRFTRHDAPLSVRRAYLPAEAWQLILGAGLGPGPDAVRAVPAPLRDRRDAGRIARRHRGRRAAVTDERVEVAVVGGGPAGARSRSGSPGPGTAWSSSSATRSGAGGPAGSSRRPRRSRRSPARHGRRRDRAVSPGRSRRCASRRRAGSRSGSPTATSRRSASTGRGSTRRCSSWPARPAPTCGPGTRSATVDLDARRLRVRSRATASCDLDGTGRRRRGRPALGRGQGGGRRPDDAPAEPARARLPRRGRPSGRRRTPDPRDPATATSGSRRCRADG